jgi:hypothetical protein
VTLTGRVILVRILIVVCLASAAYGQPVAGPSDTSFRVDERIHYFLHRTFSLQRLALLGVDTAIDHLLESPSAWGRAPESFTYRYSSSFGKRMVRNSIELGAGIALGEDTRFRQSQERGFVKRVRFAATSTLLARHADGNRGFAYSRLAATTGGILISSSWYPCRRSPHYYAEQVGYAYLDHLQNSLLTEFSPDMIRLGKRVRSRIFGK